MQKIAKLRDFLKHVYIFVLSWLINIVGAWHVFISAEHHWLEEWQIWLVLILFFTGWVIRTIDYINEQRKICLLYTSPSPRD